MRTHLVNSADSHVVEPLDLWVKRLPASLRDRAPRIEDVDGQPRLLVEGMVPRRMGGGANTSHPLAGPGRANEHGRRVARRDLRLSNLPSVSDPPKSFHLSPAIHDYIVEHGTPPDDVQRWLIAETKARVPDLSMMQIAPEQGAFMTVLTRLLNVRQAVEVGTFTGYSSLCIARGLAPGGRLLCCDVSEDWTALARDAWERGNVADRIELRIAPAIDTLRSLPTDEVIDLAFIDADKRGYAAYYEELVRRLRPNGVIMVDNTLWMGTVVDESVTDDDTKAIRVFNDSVAHDGRVEAVLLPVGDGLTMLRKR